MVLKGITYRTINSKCYQHDEEYKRPRTAIAHRGKSLGVDDKYQGSIVVTNYLNRNIDWHY